MWPGLYLPIMPHHVARALPPITPRHVTSLMMIVTWLSLFPAACVYFLKLWVSAYTILGLTKASAYSLKSLVWGFQSLWKINNLESEWDTLVVTQVMAALSFQDWKAVLVQMVSQRFQQSGSLSPCHLQADGYFWMTDGRPATIELMSPQIVLEYVIDKTEFKPREQNQ